MRLSHFLQIHAAITVASGSVIPANPPFDLQSRQVDQPDPGVLNDACFNTKSFRPAQKAYDCPKKNEIQENHYCPVSAGLRGVNGDTDESYCERYLFWEYGREIPYHNMDCKEGDACALQEGLQVEVSQTHGYSAGITYEVFSAGASFEWTESKMTSVSIRHERPRHTLGGCGYWTFIPYKVTSCGVTSKARIDHGPTGSWCADRIDEEVCVTSMMKTAAGLAAGETVFVTTACASDRKLDFCFQEDSYLKPGVSWDDSLYPQALNASMDWDIYKGLDCTSLQQCLCGNWPIVDELVCFQPGFDPVEAQCGVNSPNWGKGEQEEEEE